MEGTDTGTGSVTSYNNLILANCSEGMRINGRMSAVRRFFCLFVTFEFLFLDLFWIICVLINGNSLYEVWEKEIVGYTFEKSAFDIAVCAGVRFLLLLLFYGIIQIKHWWFIVVSTSLTCLFVITKAFLFEWKRDNSYPFDVMIFLLTFIIAWVELWFIEVRVLPQEKQANQLMQGVQVVPDLNRFSGQTIVGSIQEFWSHQSETATNFYSPLESPLASEDGAEEGVETKEQTPQECEWISLGEETMDSAYDILRSNGWVEEKHISNTDTVYSKAIGQDKKKTIYKLEAVINCNPLIMFNDCIKNFENIPNWNKAVIFCKVIQVVDKNTDITYNVASEGPGGIVSSRDFVSVRCRRKVGNTYMVGGTATSHPDYPTIKRYVRGVNGPNCVVFSPYKGDNKVCLFEFLLDVNLRGWLPNNIVSQALVTVLSEFRDSIIVHAANFQQSSGR